LFTGVLLTYEKHQLQNKLLEKGAVSPQWFVPYPVPPVLPDYFHGLPAEFIFIMIDLIGPLFIDHLAELGSVPETEVNDLLLQDQFISPEHTVGLRKVTEITDKYRGEPFCFIPAKAKPVLDILLHPVPDLAFLRGRFIFIILRLHRSTCDQKHDQYGKPLFHFLPA
jgi:hypothetical protein